MATFIERDDTTKSMGRERGESAAAGRTAESMSSFFTTTTSDLAASGPP
jgi:hypothetical protein